MKEYGGYIELDTYRLPMLHEGAVALNCGRNALAYVIRGRKIRKICLPVFLCDSVRNLCLREGVEIRYYSVGADFLPEEIRLEADEWLYLVNYYGQLSNEDIQRFACRYGRVLVDQSQAYFQMPVTGVDTFYTCRKFLGVADGAFLYTDVRLEEEFPLDESFERMHFLLGRYERTASEFYQEYAANNRLFANEPIKRMSKLTNNLLHAIDYDYVRQQRGENFAHLAEIFGKYNLLRLRNVEGAFAYPLLLENGSEIRKKLQQEKIYIPTLWPNVPQDGSLEGNYAQNILPLPCDQRYGTEDMNQIADAVLRYMK